MDMDGITAFFADLKVDLEDPVTLLISYKMGADQQGKYTFDQFKKGCKEYGCDTMNKWYKVIPDCKKSLKDDKVFKEVYDFTFGFSQEAGFKNISYEYAEGLWTILMKDKCRFLQDWLDFFESQNTEIIKKDQWDMFYLIVTATKGDFANFVDDGCWASTIDEFNEYY